MRSLRPLMAPWASRGRLHSGPGRRGNRKNSTSMIGAACISMAAAMRRRARVSSSPLPTLKPMSVAVMSSTTASM